jgi:hypothetical protein
MSVFIVRRWIIGPRGTKLLDIQLKSNCKAWLNQQVPDDRPRQLVLQGNCEEDVNYCCHLVREVIEAAPIAQAMARSRSHSRITNRHSPDNGPGPDAQLQVGAGAAVGSEDTGTLSSEAIESEDVEVDPGAVVGDVNATVLDIPFRLLGLLIGRSGWTIKRIMKQTGARITINQSQQTPGVVGDNKRVVIYGSLESVKAASEYVQALIEKGLGSSGPGNGPGSGPGSGPGRGAAGQPRRGCGPSHSPRSPVMQAAFSPTNWHGGPHAYSYGSSIYVPNPVSVCFSPHYPPVYAHGPAGGAGRRGVFFGDPNAGGHFGPGPGHCYPPGLTAIPGAEFADYPPPPAVTLPMGMTVPVPGVYYPNPHQVHGLPEHSPNAGHAQSWAHPPNGVGPR